VLAGARAGRNSSTSRAANAAAPRADLDGVAHALEEGRSGGFQQALALRSQLRGDGGGGADRVAGGPGDLWRRALERGLDGRAVAGGEDAAEHGHAQCAADLAGGVVHG
jgi:hypothetical protein